MTYVLSWLGARLGNTADRVSDHDTRSTAPRWFRAVDAVARFLYVLPDRRAAVRFITLGVVALAALAAYPISALAADTVPPDATRLFLPQTQLLVAVVGSLVPFVTYLLNHRAPWVTEQAKALVLVLVSAAAGVLTVLLDAGGVPLTWETLQLVGTAVVMAFLSHVGFWRPSGLSASLGGGSNRQDDGVPARSSPL